MFIRLSVLLFVSIFLGACGSKGSFFDQTTTTPETSSSAGTTTASKPVAEGKAKDVQLGGLNGGVFTVGVVNLEFTAIKAFETTRLSVFLVDEEGKRYSDQVPVSFKSSCSEKFFANIASPVNSVNGEATSIYTANGCVGEDIITATAQVNGKEISATATIEVEAPVINSLRYLSAIPSSLGIKGFGQAEESTVQFKIMDREGRPAPNQSITFTLNSAVGGISLYPATVTSNEQGVVSTVIHSGTTATNVRVTATLDSNTTIWVTSEVLTISTGVADQNSISLSASVLNPNAGNYDGVEVDVNIWAADHFNNPVPDGTKVYFTTEGGQIQPECEITAGGCTVKWHSSNPRPCYGRATILATMVGEESFIDANGNGVLDSNEKFFDKDEAFRDDNEDGVYNEREEEFWDFNQNGKYDTKDGKYNGVLCKSGEGNESQCSADLKNIYARDSLTLVMASDSARLQVYIWDKVKASYVEYSGGGISVPLSGTSVLVAMSGALSAVDERYDCAPQHEQEILTSLVTSGHILPLQQNLPESAIPAGYQTMPVGTKLSVSLEKGVLAPKSPEIVLGSTSASSANYLSFSLFPKDKEKVGAFSTVAITVETKGDGDIASKKESVVLGVTYPEGGPVEEEAATP